MVILPNLDLWEGIKGHQLRTYQAANIDRSKVLMGSVRLFWSLTGAQFGQLYSMFCHVCKWAYLHGVDEVAEREAWCVRTKNDTREGQLLYFRCQWGQSSVGSRCNCSKALLVILISKSSYWSNPQPVFRLDLHCSTHPLPTRPFEKWAGLQPGGL